MRTLTARGSEALTTRGSAGPIRSGGAARARRPGALRKSAGLLGTIACFAVLTLGCGRGGWFGPPRYKPLNDKAIAYYFGTHPNPGMGPGGLPRDPLGQEAPPPADRAAYQTEVVSFTEGTPGASYLAPDPNEAVGMPDFTENTAEPPHALTLGNGGVLVLKLLGDPLIDKPGPDIFVFEAGPRPEAVEVDVSIDGADWRGVGRVSGGPSAIDIGPFVKKSEGFRFIRLRDVEDSDDSIAWPGAEIDAVAAVRGIPETDPTPVTPAPAPERISISNEVLFSFDSANLSAEAGPVLDDLAAKLRERPNADILVFGHTDNVGDDAYNLVLSDARAAAVRRGLVARGIPTARIASKGMGEAAPIAPNSTKEGRAKNRRVEIVVSEADSASP